MVSTHHQAAGHEPAFSMYDEPDPPRERTELEPYDDSLIDPPHGYADYPWWHRPTEGERIIDGFEMMGDATDNEN